MIRRSEGGDFLLITQVAHARLAGELAGRIGNGRFAGANPREEALRGIGLHDSGWEGHDETPTINARGEPTDVFEMPLERSLLIWSQSTERALGGGDYAGLIVSLHGLALSSRAAGHALSAAANFAMIKFQHNQIELQETLRLKLGLRIDKPLRQGLAESGESPEEDLLRFNFRMLELCDQLSLNFCFGEAKIPVIEGVIPRPGEEMIALRVERGGFGIFTVNPWPFEGDVLEFLTPVMRVPGRVYAGEEDLRAAMASGTRESIRMTLAKK